MTEYVIRETIKDIDARPKKWEKELYSFIYRNRHTPRRVDLYYFPYEHRFSELTNIDGGWYIAGACVKVYSVNNEYTDYSILGGVRYDMSCQKDLVGDRLIDIRCMIESKL